MRLRGRLKKRQTSPNNSYWTAQRSKPNLGPKPSFDSSKLI